MLNIQSDNKEFLSILNKNPNSNNGLYLTPFKRGVLVGEIENNNSYNIYFIDNGNSYQQDSTEQLEFESLCSPLMYINSIDELFYKHLLSKDNYNNTISWLNKTYKELDIKECSISIDLIKIQNKHHIKALQTRFKDRININKIIGDVYSLKLKSNSIFQSLNEIVVICLVLFFGSRPENKPYIDDNYLTKYLHYFKNTIDDESDDYKFNSIFIRSLFVNETQFLKYENIINPHKDLQINWYNNSDIRLNEICSNINLENDVLDIGCGWFAYYKKLTKLGFRNTYYANDIDIARKDKIKELNERYSLNNIIWIDDISLLDNFNGSIIFSEVLEHMEYEKSIDLLNQIKNINFKELLITTPNKDFNNNYGLKENEFRHEDHHFELSYLEFESLIKTIFKGCVLEFKQLGDKINGIASTSYVKVVK